MIAPESQGDGDNWRQRIRHRLRVLQARLDELNHRLAQQSVPEARRSSVGRLTLEEKAVAARQNVKHR